MYLAQANGIDDIEAFFQQQWDFIENNRASELMASFINLQFFLQELFFTVSENQLIQGLSNYDVLVQQAYEYAIRKKEDVLFVTFNYDLLLEYSFAKIFSELKHEFKISDYIKYPIKLIKPHGSCNWFKCSNLTGNENFPDSLYKTKMSIRAINESIEANNQGLRYPALKNEIYTHRIDTLRGYTSHHPSNPNFQWFGLGQMPQILVPLKNKDEFILPKSHIDYLQNNLNKVTEILIIGWKGTEENFQKMLKDYISEKEISVTSVNITDRNIENVLKPALPKATYVHFTDEVIRAKPNNIEFNVMRDASVGPLTLEMTEYSSPYSGIKHKRGSFSSYNLQVLNGKVKGFFE